MVNSGDPGKWGRFLWPVGAGRGLVKDASEERWTRRAWGEEEKDADLWFSCLSSQQASSGGLVETQLETQQV